MSTLETQKRLQEIHYSRTAQEYLFSLKLENFMEATSQATQRKITLSSLELVHAKRPEIQFFNELLIQYPKDGSRRPGQVVPDNMIVVHSEPLQVEGSFNTPLQPAAPLVVMEYVSKSNERKDYEENLIKYQDELKVPYYLLFYPDTQDLTLFHLNRKGRYASVLANDDERYAIPEIEIEVAIRDGWVRYWHQGKLLPLPADLLDQLEEEQKKRVLAENRAEKESQRAEKEKQFAKHESERADMEKQRADELQSKLEAERLTFEARIRELEAKAAEGKG